MTYDMEGKTFNRLTALSQAGKDKYHNRLWLCLCTCGKETTASGYDLRSGHKKSCGCLTVEKISKLNYKHGHACEISKGAKSSTYRTWRSMKNRCYRPQEDSYQYYGARGITVCQRWLDSFEDFLEDMGERPKHTTIDRIDSTGNYEPSNCRWATASTQNLNKGLAKNSTSGFKNVSWIKSFNRWRVGIVVAGKKLYFGCYEDLEFAGLVAQEARHKIALGF